MRISAKNEFGRSEMSDVMKFHTNTVGRNFVLTKDFLKSFHKHNFQIFKSIAYTIIF